MVWFLRNCCKIKHTSAGILPFEPWGYQIDAIKSFRTNRFTIFKKCRQCGASKISGAYALWLAMFFPHKTILIVSRVNEDAMSFLREQVVWLFEHLPKWLQELWRPTHSTQHVIAFPNGSWIRSLTSHPDVMRSNSANLTIIDEAAFIQGMAELWAAGQPTLTHGGSCIVASTTNGVGNWYHSTFVDAESGLNQFHPITINWWDMSWSIEFVDPITRKHRRIAPTDGICPCTTKEEIDKYGPYKSPWLLEQYTALQERGEGWKFEQEVLASFIGSGNTVLPKNVLTHIQNTVEEPAQKIQGYQTYIHPISAIAEEINYTFDNPDEGLWIWNEPVGARPAKMRGNTILEPGEPGHNYVMGVDIATGKSKDYHAIQVLDVQEREQVAEFMARCLPRELAKIVDKIGRWYNCALLIVERNNGGDIFLDMLRYDYMYPRLYRKKDINDKPRPMKAMRARPMKVAHYGFFTTSSSKAVLNQFLLNNIRDSREAGFTLFSTRLLKQLNMYVRKKDRLGRDTGKTEAEEGAGNYDDLVMALGLALVGLSDSLTTDATNLMPTTGNVSFKSNVGPTILSDEEIVVQQQGMMSGSGGANLLLPMGLSPVEMPEISAQRILDQFTLDIGGGIPMSGGKPLVTPSRYFLQRNKKRAE